MATIPETCSKCGHRSSATVSERVFDGRLHYSHSFRCPACKGGAFEGCGKDESPAYIREPILAQEGKWQITVVRATDVVQLAAALHKRLKIDRRTAVAAAKRIPGVISTGTRAEVECLGQGLPAGTDYEISRSDS